MADSGASATIDGVDLHALAARVSTPFHAYSATLLRSRAAELQAALAGLDAMVCYAAKANSNLGVLRLLGQAGIGADIVSAGELYRCFRAGIEPARIVFSGVGKTEAEIATALAAGVWKFNLESLDELHLLQRVAQQRGVVAQAAVRINPDVDAGTHEKISTGMAANKFGVPPLEARSWFDGAHAWPNVRLDGLHMHIGSQILALEPLRAALARIGALWRELATAGHAITSIDVGGGLGVAYRHGEDSPIALADYVAAIRSELAGFAGRIVLEPGRWLVAEAGVLVARVLRVKNGASKRFLVVDAAMTELARPALYGAWHEIVPLHGRAAPRLRYEVVGPVCESSDVFAHDRPLPACEAGDLLLIAGTGAYGASMASTYNSRPLCAEVMLDRGRYAIVRERQTLAQLVEGEPLAPAWEMP